MIYTLTILMFYYNGSVDMNSNSTSNNGTNSSKIIMDDPRMLMYISIYFWDCTIMVFTFDKLFSKITNAI